MSPICNSRPTLHLISASDAIDHYMCVLTARDAAIEKWLVEEMVPTLDALSADPSRAIPAEEAWRRIQAHMDAVTAAKGDRQGRELSRHISRACASKMHRCRKAGVGRTLRPRLTLPVEPSPSFRVPPANASRPE